MSPLDLPARLGAPEAASLLAIAATVLLAVKDRFARRLLRSATTPPRSVGPPPGAT